jgi:acyl carrier protein
MCNLSVGGLVDEAPQGEIECAIAQLWKEVLGLEKVGRNDNYFELGGDSLTGMRLADAIAATLDLQLPVVAIFQNPTIRELSQLVTLPAQP